MTRAGGRRLGKLRREVLPALRADGVRSAIVPLPLDLWIGGYWMDLAWEWGMEKMKYPPAGDDGPAMLCVLWLNAGPARISESKKEIQIQFMFASKKQLVILHEILQKSFGRALKPGRKDNVITISLL